jgi:hypothetical protein
MSASQGTSRFRPNTKIHREAYALRHLPIVLTNPDSAEEGYAIREAQIDRQFATEGLPVLPFNFYNVGTEGGRCRIALNHRELLEDRSRKAY